MDKYSRYTDNKQRFFILLEKRGKPVIEKFEENKTDQYEGSEFISEKKLLAKNITIEPTTVLLLNVYNETAKEMPFKEFEAAITEGRLIPVKK